MTANPHVEVRAERVPDAPAIRRVHDAAFDGTAEGRIVDAIRPTAAFVPALSLVAVRDRRVIGHALFSTVAVEHRPDHVRPLALGPIGVEPAAQGQGVGTALMERGLAEARRLGFSFVVLVGDPGYYSRFGFTPARACGLDVVYDVPDPVFQVYELRSGDLEVSSGRVTYPEAFDRFG